MAPSLLDRYFVAGVELTPGYYAFDNAANWSLTSGGTGGETVPDATNNVFLDANSPNFVGTDGEVPSTIYCNNISLAGYTAIMHLALTTLVVAGNGDFEYNTGSVSLTGTVRMLGTAAGAWIKTKDATYALPLVEIAASDAPYRYVYVNTRLKCRFLEQVSGSFYTNGQPVGVNDGANFSGGTIYPGASTIHIGGYLTTAGGTRAGVIGETWHFDYGSNFSGFASTMGAVVCYDIRLVGNLITTVFNLFHGSAMTVAAGVTITCGDFQAANLVGFSTLRSVTSTNTWYLVCTTNSVTAVKVRDCDASGGTTVDNSAPGGVDESGNTNWIFPD